MKLIKDYPALKYKMSGAKPAGNKTAGMTGKTITDPMAWVRSVSAPIRKTATYAMTEEGIYKRTEADGTDNGIYVTSLFFVQEPELGEGANAAELSADLIDAVNNEFGCSTADDYEGLNMPDSNVCYREFESTDPEKLKELRSIIGKHVYLKDGCLIIEG